MKDIVRLGLWDEEMKNEIFTANGSIQEIDEIPDRDKAVYKTVWEIKQKTLIDMAADRGPYICQTQSLNLFSAKSSFAKLTSMHFMHGRRLENRDVLPPDESCRRSYKVYRNA